SPPCTPPILRQGQIASQLHDSRYVPRTFQTAMGGLYAQSMDPLDVFSSETRAWFERSFAAPTPAQVQGWPVIATGANTLIQAPTCSGKTLAACLYAIDRLTAKPREGLRVPQDSPPNASSHAAHSHPASPH